MSRRQFLTNSGAALLAVGGASAGRATTAISPDAVGRPGRLVVVMLRGAVDGLSVVVPYADPGYYRSRGGIAIPPPDARAGAAIDLDGYFGLHPSLAPLLPLWREGTLGFVHASGSHDPTRSHFDAQDYLETGTPGVKSTPTGWINRLLGALPGERRPTEALSLGPAFPRVLLGANPVTSLPGGNAPLRDAATQQRALSDAFDRLYAGDDALSRAWRDARTGRRDMMNALSRDMEAADRGAAPPQAFRAEAQRLALLLRTRPELRVGFLSVGGWDTHIAQGGASGVLATRLRLLAEGLAALAADLGPALADTGIVVVSEFGRTVRENGTGGTDHGHGNVIWLLGGSVAGARVHGAWPGLDEASLHEGRDLAVTTDLRTVLSTVVLRQMALPAEAMSAIFPGLGGESRVMPGLMRG